MALNIKNQTVENLLNQIVSITGESKTEAVQKALEERRQRLEVRFLAQNMENRLLSFLAEEVWPNVPSEQLGKVLTKAEEEKLLGLGELGV